MKQKYNPIMSPTKFREESEKINSGIKVEIFSWNIIEIKNVNKANFKIPSTFNIIEEEKQKLILTNFQDNVFGEYIVTVLFSMSDDV